MFVFQVRTMVLVSLLALMRSSPPPMWTASAVRVRPTDTLLMSRTIVRRVNTIFSFLERISLLFIQFVHKTVSDVHFRFSTSATLSQMKQEESLNILSE